MFYLKGFGKYPKGPQLYEKPLATKKTYKIPDNSLRLSEKSTFRGILTYEINVTQRSIAFHI